MKHVFAIVATLMICACTAAQFDAVKTVSKDIWDVARVLCLRAHADHAGVSVSDIKETVCASRAQIEPWVQPALGAQHAGAARAGMSLESDAGAP